MLPNPLNMKNTRDPLRLLLPAASTCLLFLTSHVQAEIVVGWEVTGQSGWGTQDLPATAPSYHDPDVTVSGLTRGAGFATTNSAVQNGWGGHGIEGPTTAADAITAENFVTFTVTPSATFEFSAASLDLNYRRSGTGPTHFALQYQIGAGTFADVGDFELSSTSSAGATVPTIDLSLIPELQDVSASAVTFRIVPYGATGADGTFYLYGPQSGFDLEVKGSVQTIGSSGDTDGPLVATLSPPDDSTSVTVDGAMILSVLFNEDIMAGSGDILIKNAAGGATVATIDASNFDQIEIVDNKLDIKLPSPLTAGSSYYVEIPNTAVTDLLSNPFAGISGATTWNFTVATTGAAPTVVINKYLNGPPDRVELLVIGNGIAGSTVDMRGMILKDFSSNTTGDGGANYTFTTNALWQAVPAGTLIVTSVGTASPDTTISDYVLSVGLGDTTLFTAAGGTFDIATTEVVMIKSAGSVASGITGGMHAMAAALGALGTNSFFTQFTGNKIRAATATGGGTGVYANNPTSSLADYNGTEATTATSSQLNFGAPNNGTNAAYIAALRGLLPGDGDGIATLINASAGTYNGLPVFDDAQTGQSLKVKLNAQIPGATVGNVTITIPASLGTPTTATTGGAGGGSASAVVAGQTITVSGAAATAANALEVTINGLTTPTPTQLDLGAYPLSISTSANGGSLLPIASQPIARVLVPLSFVRDVNPTTGVALDIGATVAVEGVVTEADFSGGLSNFSGYLQDASAGINVFSPSFNPGLVRGNHFALVGSILQFNGLTEISPSGAANVFNLGAATAPTPQVVSLATLFADPESYEGELITVQNLSFLSGVWGTSSTNLMLQSGSTPIQVFIQPGSTATTEPAYPVTITGIFGQFDSTTPYTGGYQLMPRDPDDLAAGTLGGFDAWAASNGIPGEPATGDFDKDGLSNLMEYALGLNPTTINGTPGTLNGSLLSFTKGAAAMANGDVTWVIEDSTTLGAAPDLWAPVTTVEAGNTISYTLPTGQGKIFARLTVTQITPP